MNEQNLRPSFTLGEIKDKAMVLTKKHWIPYLCIGLVGFVVIAPLEIASAVLEMEYGSGMLPVVISAISLIAQLVLAIAMTRYALVASEDRHLSFKEYFACNVKMVIALAVASLLYVIMMVAGFLALIVPGVILMIAFSPFGFPIVEKNMGPIDALRTSWNITKGNRANIFFFSLAVFAVGMIALLVPMLFVAIPFLFDMQGAFAVSVVLGVVAFIWMLVAGMALETFATIASALMYRKMVATRK